MVAGAFWFISDNFSSSGNTSDTFSVSVVGDKQIIDIFAKGGYSPRVIAAKANLPTILRVKTRGTLIARPA